MAGQDTIDLATDPPPDLVVEVDITHPSLDKFPIYASLRVPEVWRHDGEPCSFFACVVSVIRRRRIAVCFPWYPLRYSPVLSSRVKSTGSSR